MKNFLQQSSINARESVHNTRLMFTFGEQFLRLLQILYLPATDCGGHTGVQCRQRILVDQEENRGDYFLVQMMEQISQLIDPRQYISQHVKVLVMKDVMLCVKQPRHSSLTP